MTRHIKEELARVLLATLVACNGGELIIDAGDVKLKDIKGRLVMVPLVERRAYKVLLLDDNGPAAPAEGDE